MNRLMKDLERAMDLLENLEVDVCEICQKPILTSSMADEDGAYHMECLEMVLAQRPDESEDLQ